MKSKILSLLGLTSWLLGRSYTSNFHKKDEFIQSVSTALPVRDGITALGGGGQENATPLSNGINIVETGGAGDSIAFSNDMAIGYPIVINNQTGNDISIWPPEGGSINGTEDSEWNLEDFERGYVGYKVGDNAFILVGTNEI